MTARLQTVRRTAIPVLIALLVAMVLAAVAAPAPAQSTIAAVPGSAGTDTMLPATDSAVTVSGRDQFADLQITVNQTRDLVNQAVSISWTGGRPTIQTPRRFSGNYLQIMQCWGDDDGSVPGSPGPPPEQCVQGAAAASSEGGVARFFPPSTEAMGRTMSKTGWASFDPSKGFLDSRTGRVWRNFRSVDGTEVGVHIDPTFNPALSAGSFWLNPYYDITTSNEVAGVLTGPNGKGSTSFEVATGVESSGLGCGQTLVPAGGGTPRIPKCWLVVVPRGTPTEENAGTPFAASADVFGVMTSPLSDAAWRNRIAIPLDFQAIGSSCSLAAKDRRLVGSELIASAVASWQPALCATPGSPPYSFATIPDAQARQVITAPTAGAPGMAVASRPIDPASVDPSSPAVYAPLTLSGVVVGFAIDRSPKVDAPQAEQDLNAVSVADMNLTPRLLAKLLTQSYRNQVAIVNPGAPYPWADANPADLGQDPDFLQFNPEFALLNSTSSKNLGGLLNLGRNSDLAYQVWRYVLADPEAKRWLDGEPDAWGMSVNPVYATTAAANSNGLAFADPVPESFPKADPYCFLSAPINGDVVPPAVCGTDWLPYVGSLLEAARFTRLGDDRAKVSLNPFALTPDQAWKRYEPQPVGQRTMLSLTDTASANRYGIQMARLSQAGDDGAARTFVSPTAPALAAAVKGMVPSSEPAVLEPDPSVRTPSAYPLASLTYGIIRPLTLDAAARADYAAFVDYASGAGQVAGLKEGQLPNGYAPLPQQLKDQAQAAATTIRTLEAPAPTPPTERPPAEPSSFSPSGGFGSPSAFTPSPSSSGGKTSAPAPAAAAPTPVAAAATATDDGSSGGSGLLTPIVAVARSRYVLPILATIALLAALGALEVTKRPRRAQVTPTPGAGK